MTRPGPVLLQSLIAEEGRGRPGAAAAAAQAAGHPLDVAAALLVGGEPRAANAVLDGAAPGPQHDAMRVWAGHLDRNCYPGWTGGEPRGQVPTFQPAFAGDPETAYLQACVGYGLLPLLATRAFVEAAVRQGAPAASEMAQMATQSLEGLRAVATGTGDVRTAAWARVAQADLARRSGAADAAVWRLRELQAAAPDPVAYAFAVMTEGDWYATPGSSPEALGFDLAQQNLPSPRASDRDPARAATLYATAANSLPPGAAPRLEAALALRRAVLAWQAADLAGQRLELDAAGAAFAEAGDAAGTHLVAIHTLVGALAGDDLAAVRLAHGTGWDLRPRGTVAAVADWAGTRGSLGFAAGLGRLLQRAAEGWRARGELDRAAVALGMAHPLLAPFEALLGSLVLEELAAVDGARGFPIRALVRLEQSITGLPPLEPVGDDPQDWMLRGTLLVSAYKAQSDRAGSSSAGRGLAGLARTVAALHATASAEGVPGREAAAVAHVGRDGPAAMAAAARFSADQGLDALAGGGFARARDQHLALTAQMLRATADTGAALVELQRARVAAAGGWTEGAARGYEAALRLADDGVGEDSFVGVLACVSSGREEEARRRFADARAHGGLPDDLLGLLAARAREWAVAAELMGPEPAGAGWRDLVDRCEVRLETGDAAGAAAVAGRAIASLEAEVAGLPRDPDRLAVTDNAGVAVLFALAVRATLAVDPDATDAALSLAERLRALTLAHGQAAGDGARRWQQLATEWSAAFERLLAAYEAGTPDAAAVAAAIEALAAADDDLVAAEATLPPPAVVAPAAPVAAPDLRGALPSGACVLSYLFAPRELRVFAVTAQRTSTASRRVATGEVEALVRAVWSGCAAGAPGEEAAVLADLLLGPVADVLRASDRVVVVPAGPLAAVPFHALPLDGAPLADGRVVSYASAVARLAGRPLDAPLPAGVVMAVGDPAFSGADLPRLPGAALEARAVGARWPGATVLIDAWATEAAVRTGLERAAVVHLAAHGHLDEVAPSTSALVLAGADRLTVADLIGVRVDARLAVLSACDSGRGVAMLGGDVVGLTRGLVASGVQQAIVSLWPVDDRSACVTMDRLHARLAAGEAPAPALAAVQAELRATAPDALDVAYAALGGDAAAPSLRRGVPLDPEFVDVDPGAGAPAGAQERTWAPFVLVDT